MHDTRAQLTGSSAWKQFFFIDCLGLSELLCPTSRRKSAARNLDRRMGRNRNELGCQGEYRAKQEGGQAKGAGGPAGRDDGGPREQVRQKQGQRQRQPKLARPAGAKEKRPERSTVESPINKALIQTDPLFHLYLICVGLITLSILAIKCLIPGMPIYTHTVIGFAFLLAIILVSTVYTQVKSKKVSDPFPS